MTKWVAVSALAATGLFSALAAKALPGHSKVTTSDTTQPTDAGATSGTSVEEPTVPPTAPTTADSTAGTAGAPAPAPSPPVTRARRPVVTTPPTYAPAQPPRSTRQAPAVVSGGS